MNKKLLSLLLAGMLLNLPATLRCQSTEEEPTEEGQEQEVTEGQEGAEQPAPDLTLPQKLEKATTDVGAVQTAVKAAIDSLAADVQNSANAMKDIDAKATELIGTVQTFGNEVQTQVDALKTTVAGISTALGIGAPAEEQEGIVPPTPGEGEEEKQTGEGEAVKPKATLHGAGKAIVATQVMKKEGEEAATGRAIGEMFKEPEEGGQPTLERSQSFVGQPKQPPAPLQRAKSMSDIVGALKRKAPGPAKEKVE